MNVYRLEELYRELDNTHTDLENVERELEITEKRLEDAEFCINEMWAALRSFAPEVARAYAESIKEIRQFVEVDDVS